MTCAIDVLRLDDNSTADKDNIIKIVIEKDFIFFLVGLSLLFLSILLRALLLFLFFGLCVNNPQILISLMLLIIDFLSIFLQRSLLCHR